MTVSAKNIQLPKNNLKFDWLFLYGVIYYGKISLVPMCWAINAFKFQSAINHAVATY